MKTLLRILIVFIAVWTLILPLEALAASSSSVTSINTAFEDRNLEGEDFSGQNLQEAQFTNVKMTAANLSNANLIGAVFNGALMDKVNLHGANLSYGLSYLSNFNQADLSDAILVGAILKRSSFVGVNITGADFTDSAIDPAEINRLCQIASGVNSKTGVLTKESLECR